MSPEPAPVILLVEDDILLRVVTAGHLRRSGFEVIEAANSTEAVWVLECIAVDAMVSNIDIPGKMNGLDLAQLVRRRRLDTKIILTSAVERTLGEAEEYVRFISKPYHDGAVEDLLRSVLSTTKPT